MEVLDVVPDNCPLYVYIHERDKGIYDDVLQRNMDGKLRYPLIVKNLALTYLRRWDQRWHKRLWKRPQSAVSANTPTKFKTACLITWLAYLQRLDCRGCQV